MAGNVPVGYHLHEGGVALPAAQELLYAVKNESTVISPDRQRVLTFDREGRLFSYFRHGRTYRRDLSSHLHLRTGGGTVRHWAALDPAASDELLAEAYAVAREAGAGAPADLRKRLDEEIARWDLPALLAQAEKYAKTYTWPPSILPPDCYLSIVLQASTGCSWNKCTFCALYRDRPFQVRTPEEFRRHTAQVADLFGRARQSRKGVFLADGNALSMSLERLAPLAEIASDYFPDEKLYGFIDLYSGQRGEEAKWQALARLGFHRVYIGMETGDDELLSLLNKPGSRAELAEFVTTLKASGLAVGLIVMVGAGGRQWARRHADATVAAMADLAHPEPGSGRLALDGDDYIFLSPFLEQAGTEYPQQREQYAWLPLTETETEAELQHLARRLRQLGLRTTRYDLRAFLY